VAGIAWLLAIALALVAFVVRQGNNAALLSTVSGPELLMELLFWELLLPLSPLAYATVGAIIVMRRPYNTVGWFSLALALTVVTQDVAWQYATRVLELRVSNWPYPAAASLIAEGASVLFPLFAALLLARFPDGRLPGSRWRILTWMAVVAGLLLLLSVLVGPNIYVGLHSSIVNPLPLPVNETAAELLWLVGNGLALAALAGSFVAVGVRWRRAWGQERQQIKWLAYVGAVILVAGALAAFSTALVGETSYLTVVLLGVAVAGLTLGVPAAVGVAIMRYRLYDIDAVIRRTLVYTLLTLALILVYSASVVLLQWLFLLATGEQSDVAIVGSTAAIATLFNPFRRRIQAAIDRRFYRLKYNAARTLAGFAAAARDEVDLERLAAALLQVVGETMQPATLSLWLPGDPARQRRVDRGRV
jgi:hypothetical protein